MSQLSQEFRAFVPDLGERYASTTTVDLRTQAECEIFALPTPLGW